MRSDENQIRRAFGPGRVRPPDGGLGLVVFGSLEGVVPPPYLPRRPDFHHNSLGQCPPPLLVEASWRLFWIPFFDCLFYNFFYRFWIDLGFNLPLNLAAKSIQNRPKSRPNLKPTCIMFSMSFFIDFGSILGRFLEGFGIQVEGQIDKQIDHMASCWQVGRNSKNYKKPISFFYSFWVSRPSIFEAKLTRKRLQGDQKSSTKLMNILTQFLIDF